MTSRPIPGLRAEGHKEIERERALLIEAIFMVGCPMQMCLQR